MARRPRCITIDMPFTLITLLMALQEVPVNDNSANVLGVSLMTLMIAVVMVCLLLIGILSFGSRRRNRTGS